MIFKLSFRLVNKEKNNTPEHHRNRKIFLWLIPKIVRCGIHFNNVCDIFKGFFTLDMQ